MFQGRNEASLYTWLCCSLRIPLVLCFFKMFWLLFVYLFLIQNKVTLLNMWQLTRRKRHFHTQITSSLLTNTVKMKLKKRFSTFDANFSISFLPQIWNNKKKHSPYDFCKEQQRRRSHRTLILQTPICNEEKLWRCGSRGAETGNTAKPRWPHEDQ